MSKSSIYENNWTDLVFENKNKEYGAYQLRHENSKTTITALFMGMLLLVGLGSVSMLINKFRTVTPPVETPIPIDPHIVPVDLSHPIAPPPPPAPPMQQQTTAAPATDLSQLVNPVVTAPDQAVDNIAPNTQNAPVVDNASTGGGDVTNAIPGSNGGGNIEAPPSNVNTNNPVNSAILDKMPEFPGGIAKFYSYVGNNFTKPELDAEKTLKVYVSFVIERDGSMTDIIVRNDPGYGMGKEAIRVLKSLRTKWIPGVLDGKPVRTAYNLPITIKTEVD
jgi:protein TonB